MPLRITEYFGYALKTLELAVKEGLHPAWLPPEPILEMESPGLCPFLPLMDGKPEDLVIRSVTKIRAAPEAVASAEEKRDLLQVLASLAGRVITNMDQLTEMILSDQELLESHPLYKKGQKAAAQEGEQALREAILEVLVLRIGEVPEDVCRRLEEIHALAELKSLVARAAQAQDMESFRRALGNAAE